MSVLGYDVSESPCGVLKLQSTHKHVVPDKRMVLPLGRLLAASLATKFEKKVHSKVCEASFFHFVSCLWKKLPSQITFYALFFKPEKSK
uniref:Uncharacterized protein n=1 Tax=Octopus bimaculoides TaxID=37653 RepID=A0A0L8GKV7_OCTBM